jgi:hypothetical protein
VKNPAELPVAESNSGAGTEKRPEKNLFEILHVGSVVSRKK